MFCQEGMEAVNARSVAKALNCSTQPIFSYYSGMSDLKSSLDQKAREMFEGMLAAAVKENDTLNGYCMAYVFFAMEQPHLFQHMFLNMGKKITEFPTDNMLSEPLWQAESQQSGISLEQAKEVCVNTLVYVHGLASIQASRKSFVDKETAEHMIRQAHAANLMMVRSR